MDQLEEHNPFDPEVLQCPHPHYARLRDQSPVQYLRRADMYLVTRHDLVLQILRNPALYSSRFESAISSPADAMSREVEKVIADGYPRVPVLISADAPEHTRYRRLVNQAFTPKAVAELEPIVRAITRRLIGRWFHGSHGDRVEIDFVSQFAVPLPVEVIAHALNVDQDRLDDFKRWSDDSIAGIGTEISLDERIEAERGVNEFQHYFAEQFEERRAHPRDDLLTRLLHARIDDDDPEVIDTRSLDLAEMLSLIQHLLVAGNETTTKLLSEIVRLLAEHPNEWAAVRADPTRASKIAEEALRLSTPTQGMFRVVTEDHSLGGVRLRRGGRIVAVYAAANRDPNVFERPDHFDPSRDNHREHVAFGKGIHFCLGASLARLEARVVIEELAQHVERLELVDSDLLEYFPSFLLRGLTRLPVSVTRIQQRRRAGAVQAGGGGTRPALQES